MECSHECGSCSENCSEQANPKDFIKKPHELSNIKKVIGVVSGKGGVGKSLITALLACLSQKNGYKTAVLDADITGPSIPKIFGIKELAVGTEIGIMPAFTKTDIEAVSLNLMIDDETQPVIWRGPVISGVVEQFWTDVIWGDVDFMFIDMPPGTGDVPLTVFQSIPVDGIVIVASPQELVQMIVEKAVNMANMMDIPILGIVENMSCIKCPDCGKEIKLFGESHVEEISKTYDIPLIGKLPIDPEIAKMCDDGCVEDVDNHYLDNFLPILEKMKQESDEKENRPFKLAVSYDNDKVFEHFGHSKQFKIYTFTGSQMTNSEVVDTASQGHSAVVDFLIQNGIEAVICGNIGKDARKALSDAGIYVFAGVNGDCDQAAKDWFDGTLNYDPDITCMHRDSAHSCNGECSCGGCR